MRFVVKLTPRQSQVLERLARGQKYAEMAKDMGCSAVRARGHAAAAAKRFQAPTVFRAVVLYASMYMDDIKVSR